MSDTTRIALARPAPPVQALNAAPTASTASAAPDPSVEADRAAVQLHGMSRTAHHGAGRTQRLDRAMRRLVQNYQQNPSDRAGMIHLLRRPEIGRAVAGASEDEIEASLGRVDPGLTRFFERHGVVGALRESFDASIRGDIVRNGTSRINRRRAVLGGLQATVLGDLPRFRGARPGTPEAIVADRLGIRGDAGDAARVREHIVEAQDGLDEMQDWLQGQTWENGDLEHSATTAAARRGWHMTRADAIIEHSLIGEHSVDVAVHAGLEITEHAHIGIEGVEVAEGLEAGLAAPAVASLAVGLAGLGFGLYIHHLGQEQQAEHIAAAHELGL